MEVRIPKKAGGNAVGQAARHTARNGAEGSGPKRQDSLSGEVHMSNQQLKPWQHLYRGARKRVGPPAQCKPQLTEILSGTSYMYSVLQ
eukprot:5953787-Amphidinium_carterae.1